MHRDGIEPRTYRTIKRLSRAGALLVACVGAVVLLGWLLDVTTLSAVLPGLATMKVNSALAFVAAGVALWALHRNTQRSRSLAVVLAVTVATLGGLSLAEYLLGVDLGIDQLVVRDILHTATGLPPGRMAPATALNFLLVGLALLTMTRRESRARVVWTSVFAVPPLFIAAVACVGYAYGVSSLYRVGPYTSMAPHTAASFVLISLSILTADPSRGIAGIVSGDTVGGILTRRLLPTIPLLLFGLGWAGLAGQEAGLYDTRFGFALMVVVSITVSIFAVVSTAATLHAIDMKRLKAEAEIIGLNAGLERRVQMRTQELQDTLAQVRQLSGLLPICAWCKKVRDDSDYWQSVEEYVTARTDASFTHSICPDCSARFAGEEGTDGGRRPEHVATVTK